MRFIFLLTSKKKEAHKRWRRCQQTCKQWSKDCCESRQIAGFMPFKDCFAWGMPFERQLAGCHSRNNSLSISACTSDDTFAIVHALLDRVDGCARSTMFATSLTLCPTRRSAETYTRWYHYEAILKNTTITNLFFDITVTEHLVS